MIVGTLRVRLLLRSAELEGQAAGGPEHQGSAAQRLQRVGGRGRGQDNRQLAVLGFAMVSNEAHPSSGASSRSSTALRGHPVAELLDHEMEV